jgi:hypothetical protein
MFGVTYADVAPGALVLLAVLVCAAIWDSKRSWPR